MHLLFLSSLLPEPEPSTGFAIANRAIADAYARAGARLTFAGFRTPCQGSPEAGEIALGTMEIENGAASPGRKACWVARAFARNLPVSAAKLKVLSERRLGAQIDAAGPFDAIVLNSIQMPAAYPFLLRKAPTIFIAHNVEHRSARENAASATSLANRLLYRREAALLERAEARTCRLASVVHTLSEADRSGLGLADAPNAFPLALPTGRKQAPDDGVRAHDVGMIGTWSWAPNRVGLDWFVKDVAPLLLPAGIGVAIAGRFDGAPPPAPRNVRFHGRVDDAQGFVRASRVVALATRGGTGVQLKTIETFEEGLPAVATTAALRGVDFLPANVALADDAPGFAAALLRQVEAERAGTLVRGDGTAFAAQQTRALDRAVSEGLRVLQAAMGRQRSQTAQGGAFAPSGSPALNPADAYVRG